MTSAAETVAQEWSFSPPGTTKGGIKLHNVSLQGGNAVSFLLGPLGTFPSTIPFAPSTFEGRESASGKKSLVFTVDDKTYRAVEEMERRAMEALDIDASKWNSALRPAGQYPATLRVKTLETLVVDESGKFTKWPDPWKRQEANALIRVKGVYSANRNGSGLMLEVEQAQIRPEKEGATETAQSIFSATSAPK